MMSFRQFISVKCFILVFILSVFNLLKLSKTPFTARSEVVLRFGSVVKILYSWGRIFNKSFVFASADQMIKLPSQFLKWQILNNFPKHYMYHVNTSFTWINIVAALQIKILHKVLMEKALKCFVLLQKHFSYFVAMHIIICHKPFIGSGNNSNRAYAD